MTLYPLLCCVLNQSQSTMEFIKGVSGSNKEEEFVINGPDVELISETKGLGDAFFKSMMKFRHSVAQRDGITGVKDTYGHLLHRSIRTALEMRARGITSQDIVTLCSLNHLNSCVPLIATAFLGATMACLDPALSLADTIHLVKQVRPKMAFVGPEALKLVENALDAAGVEAEIVVFGPTSTHSEFADFFAPKANEEFNPVEIADNKDTAVILFSSGTTGMPKGICLSHNCLVGQAYNIKRVGYTLDVSLTFASFYWISSTILLTACVLTGSCRVVVPRYSPDTFWKLLDQFKVTLTFMAPSQAITMYHKGRPEKVNTTHLADAMIGGGPISGDHVKKIRDIFPGSHIGVIYGQTEVAGIALCFQPNIRKQILMMYEKPESTGMVMPGFACKIVDPETEEILGPNQQGELRIQSEFILNGYFNLNSSSTWDSDGWLKTGDIAYFDEDRCFYIVDRIKEMLKFQSYHVPPAIIEGVLLSHPSIAAAVVVGIPHEKDGDHPIAVVVLKNPDDEVRPNEIVKFVETRVDDRQRLRGGVRFVNKLPLTATGKIKRADVKQMVLEGNI